MTLRKLHNNIALLKQTKTSRQRVLNSPTQSITYDEQPPHPRTAINRNKVWNKLDIDLASIKQSLNNNKNPNSSRMIGKITSQNKNSFSKQLIDKITPTNKEVSLFVPQRDKYFKDRIKRKDNLRHSSFSIKNKSTHQNIQNTYELTQSRNQINLFKFPQQNTKLMPLSSTINVSTIRKFQKKLTQRQQLMKNRLKFMSVDHSREQHKLDLIKKKYQKIIVVRDQSQRQKQLFKKKRLEDYLKDIHNKQSKIKQIKHQKSEVQSSISRNHSNKSMLASRVRQQNILNDRKLQSKQMIQLQKKKQSVRKTQSSIQSSRSKLKQQQRIRINSVRSIQNKNMIRNYTNVQQKQKMNQKLYKTLQKQIKLINQRKLKAASQLQSYESFLGLNKKSNTIEIKRKDKNSSHNKVGSSIRSGSKSFYLTHC